MNSDRIEGALPALKEQAYEITSDESETYNCIAWALHDTKQWWWPTTLYGCYWPPGVPRENTREAVIKVFEMHGYTNCDSGELEPGYEKVAIYERSDTGIEHAARQLQDGEWTSKIGEWEDIRHRTPQSVECEDYGKVVQIMKRPRKE